MRALRTSSWTPSPTATDASPKVIGNFTSDGAGTFGALDNLSGFALYPQSNAPYGPYVINSVDDGFGLDEDAQVADINRDGANDIVVGGIGKHTYWLENPRDRGADPLTSAWTLHTIDTSRQSHDVVVGDILRNGKMDVATDSGIYLQNSPTSWSFVGAPNLARTSEGTSLANITSDGILDVVAPYGSSTLAWFENPLHHGGNPLTGTWTPHVIDNNLGFKGSDGVTSAEGDFNRDGHVDVASAPMYDNGNLVWYQAPSDPRNGTWIKHVIGSANYVHQGSLQIADFDGDGSADIAFAEQEQSATKRVGVWYGHGAGGSWSEQILETTGGHNLKAGIVGHDRLPSILTANHGYYGAANPLELWRNH